MKIIRLVGFALAMLLLSFCIVYLGLEVAKLSGYEDLGRARQPFDAVIINVLVIDGTGQEPFRGQIGIRGNKIHKIGTNLNTKGALIFDFAGYTVAPRKVEWVQKPQWVERDLPTALLRYPANRLVIVESFQKDWLNKTVQGLQEAGIERGQLLAEFDTRVMIVPLLKVEITTIPEGFYNLTGLRAELLEINKGKIQPGYDAELVVYNHRALSEDDIMAYLAKEELPPYDYYISGTELQSTKGN